jgi:hypothetical protein
MEMLQMARERDLRAASFDEAANEINNKVGQKA